MEAKKRKQTIFCALVAMIITLLLLALEEFVKADFIAITAIFVYGLMIVGWQKYIKRIDFYTLFLICTYVFYFGRYLLVLISRDVYYKEFIRFYNERTLNHVAIFILLCISVMNISYVLFGFSGRMKSKEKNFWCQYKISKNALKIVAWVMFFVSFFFSIRMILVNIKTVQLYGYAYMLREYYAGYRVERFFSLFLPGSFVLLFMIYKNTSKIKLVVLLCAIYSVLYFVSGSRLQAILLILALVLTYEMEFKHITKKKMLKLGMGAVLLCFVLIVISSIRNGIQYYNNIGDLVVNIKEELYEKNFLLELINECGFQINSIAVVMINCPRIIDYNYGITYLKGIGQLIPNLFWSQNPFMQESTDTIFGHMLNGGTFGIGSSFIAEAYYNFGYLSILLMILVGWLFAKYQFGLIDAYNKSNNILLRYIYLSIPTFALFYVRTDAVGILKAVVYRCMIPAIAVIVLSSILKRKSKIVRI